MKENKGITLIALIITIILLLILVGVSINLAIKGNLFGSAEKAVSGTNDKVAQEQTRVDEFSIQLISALISPKAFRPATKTPTEIIIPMILA